MQALRAAPATTLQQQGSRRSPAAQRALVVPRASAEAQQAPQTDRRSALLALVAAGAALSGAAPQVALAGASKPSAPVGEYLPAAEGLPGFCLYVPDAKKTPAIRAGVIKPDPAFYRFAMPEGWSEAPLLNPQTGNFCMPRCEEPWYEFKFEGKEGSAQLIATELQKLGAKPGAKLEQLGTPEAVVSRIGNFITGTSVPDEEDVVAAERREGADGRPYYVYEVYTPYSKTAPHQLAAFATKGDLALLFVLNANDKQWAASEGTLRKVLATFQA